MPVQTVRLAATDPGAAAGTTNENILTGTKWEFPARPTAVRIWAAADPAANTVEVDCAASNVIAGENLAVGNAIAGGAMPQKNTDGLIDFMAMPGQRIQIRVRNPAGAASTSTYLIEFIER